MAENNKQSSAMVTRSDAAIVVRDQVNLIQEVMKEVMKVDVHYGLVPGCGKKPTLLKPGAEKLSMTFHLRPIIDNARDINIEDMGNGHRDIRVYCHVLNMDGVELATGVGSCSTMESKYRYRGGEKECINKPVPTEYWNLKNAGKIEDAKALIGGPGFGVGKFDGAWQICVMGEKMENPDIADVWNTVLKIAKKRAYVDGILSATAASDIFTQDIEDMPEAVKEAVKEPAKSAPADMPKSKTEAPSTAAPGQPSGTAPATSAEKVQAMETMLCEMYPTDAEVKARIFELTTWTDKKGEVVKGRDSLRTLKSEPQIKLLYDRVKAEYAEYQAAAGGDNA